MRRYFLFGTVGLLFVSTAVWFYLSIHTPTSADYGLARGRSLLDAENYIGALETVRSLPEVKQRRADVHTLLGTAYLRLHLYLAAIKEFENAERQGSRFLLL